MKNCVLIIQTFMLFVMRSISLALKAHATNVHCLLLIWTYPACCSCRTLCWGKHNNGHYLEYWILSHCQTWSARFHWWLSWYDSVPLSVIFGYTPGYMECIHPVCSHSDVIHQIFSFSGTRSDTESGFVSITAPPVGIYEVTVFGEDNGESEIRNFNESAMFITKQG